MALLGLFVLFAGASLSVWRVYQKDKESAILRTEAQLQLQDLTGRQDQLETDIAKLKTDRGVEEQLRQQFALAAAGEHMIVIVDPPAPVPIQATTTLMDRIKKALRWW